MGPEVWQGQLKTVKQQTCSFIHHVLLLWKQGTLCKGLSRSWTGEVQVLQEERSFGEGMQTKERQGG